MKTINRFYSIFLLNCTGPKGDTGMPGNANVMSVQYTVQPNNWIGNLDGYSATLNVPEITSDIYTNGTVLVYIYNLQNSTFNMLPYTNVDNSSTIYMDFDAYVGNIILYFKTIDNGVNTTQAPNGTEIFKVVIVEGTPLTALKENVNVTNYISVAKFLGITDKNTLVRKN